jgi:hypothetical protein
MNWNNGNRIHSPNTYASGITTWTHQRPSHQFSPGVDIDGQAFKDAKNHGYLTINLRGKGKTDFIRRMVATLFQTQSPA